MNNHSTSEGSHSPERPDFNKDRIKPVTMPRVSHVLNKLGYTLHSIPAINGDILEIPWPEHSDFVSLRGGSDPVIIVDAKASGALPLHYFNEVAAAVTLWNNERVSPIARISYSPDSHLQLAFRSANSAAIGATDLQLAEFLELACDATLLSVNWFLEKFPELSSSAEPPQSPFEDIEVSSDTASLFDTPSTVTMERITPIMSEVSSTWNERALLPTGEWHADIEFGCSLESGPTILCWGVWDSGLSSEREFSRVFMLCNRWNEENTESKAFVSTTAHDSLSIRVEATVDVGGGLNDTQLAVHLEQAFSAIFMCVRTLKSPGFGLYDVPPGPEHL
ncbi:YbjN domain-containing protein [Corynebacterium ulcerans]|uniref:YbjN domain-containing protein n=1 Tax=Corynebacterium ulcerans TaxID=65058 RepID=UPI00051F658D|nr:YbjN domain-containing protein [Corynebacterium ulcerans]AIT89488.1 Hypothetical protein Cul210932_1551 [Corynebacterium ulcerans]ALD95273.1 Hypothetical protein Cul131001_1577 [Corynebacterium ulcerans]SQG59105.1 Uncharacterised protein [Corynebacterium ulcerans]